MTLKVTRTITVNGKEYHSLDELPPDVRALYDQAMASGKKEVTVKRIAINVNGREIGGMGDVPADARDALAGPFGVPKQTTSPVVIAAAILGAIVLIALALLRLR
jgi:pyrrolidone-carboxylate peptidase